ncbi:MAG TPA: flagellar protein FlbA [Planctomycetaceae bacterium]|nr:flagellar protein FlbA [Planctomycetaceae bacterium]
MADAQQQLSRGWQIHQQGQHVAAERIYREVLASQPNNPAAWCYLGIVLHDQKRYLEAVETYERSLKLQPEFPIALNNLGNTLRYVGDAQRADECFAEALRLKPDYLNAYKNRGTLHVWTGSLEKAGQYYQAALKLNPTEAELHRNLGVLYLLQGRFEEGWREYRWRWRVGDLHRPTNTIPVWNGEPLEGKRILLTAEQGLGDTINFVRFAKLLRERGAETLVYCQPQLVALLQTTPELGPIYPNSLSLQGQQFHYQASLVDVADVLNVAAESIPFSEAYLQPASHLVEYWRERIGQGGVGSANTTRKRIGIAWQGNPDHQADVFRSAPLEKFKTLDNENIELYSFQTGYGSEQLANWSGRSIQTFGKELDQSSGAFMDSAAIMTLLDAVVTTDTAIAHLAGALGVRTHLALNYVPDWRWLLDREDTQWYASMTLHRQKAMGDWGPVFEGIASALAVPSQ